MVALSGIKESPLENGNFVEENKIKVEYDELLATAGKFGKYQMWLVASVSPFYIFGVFIYFTQIFITEVPSNYWCWIPELENLTAMERRRLAIPESDSYIGYSRCTNYVANWTAIIDRKGIPNLVETEKCQSGWEFDYTDIPYSTISTEMEWVCDKDSYQASAQSMFFIGCIIGGFVIGWVSDRFGRLPATVVSNVLGCIGGVTSIFARNFLEFTICRIFMGMAYDNCMMMMYLLLLEFTVPQYRSVVSNMTYAVFYTIGLVTLPWIALACSDWKMLSLATSIPVLISLAAPFILPESPRWLLSKGQVENVIDNIRTIGQVNKKEISQDMIENFRKSALNEEKVIGTMTEMLKSSSLRNLFLCVCMEYFCCMAVFDALVRIIDSLKFNFFISFTVISFTELPSLLLLSLILDRTGRKWLSIVVMTICGIFSLLTFFVGDGLPSVMCSVVARFCVNMGCNTIIQWSAELMPTAVRGSATSIVHTTGYIATAISPFIAYIDNYVDKISFIIMGSLAIIAAFLSLYLPETANKELPQTFNDAEDMIRNKKMFDLPCSQRKRESLSLGNINNAFQI